MERERAANPVRQQQQAGKPLVGGPFSLVDQDGVPRTDLDFRGRWMFVYFGFTHCPDVCPEELERMARVIDNLEKSPEVGPNVLAPIFISCDPKRDSVEAVRMYVKDFHPKLVGLTGTYDQVKSAAKMYRLYFSAPPRALDDDETDYLVDHSIFFYLVDPAGRYARHYGKIDTVERMTEDITRIVREYKARK
ncbi:SCO1/SenC-domain-containing protein [Hyaloraphidium curvatum]|nr:SCO1/SenC-domain-containing protein [Hyaloraphidium curvatum]